MLDLEADTHARLSCPPGAACCAWVCPGLPFWCQGLAACSARRVTTFEANPYA